MTPIARTGAAALALVALAGCGGGSAKSSESKGTRLTGLFAVAAGTCTGGTAGGSTFRMVNPGGTVAKGPFVANADSSCTDKTVTLLAPGTAGGLRAGTYQAETSPAFLANGSSTSADIVAPVSFFAVKFGVSTNATDPQTRKATALPTVTRDGKTLTADLSSWAVAWNGQHFNQGAPKPGASGGQATGTFDEGTGRFTLDWTSKIAGGPFNGFTGVWHLEGSYRSA
jgi:hypothetical protein